MRLVPSHRPRAAASLPLLIAAHCLAVVGAWFQLASVAAANASAVCCATTSRRAVAPPASYPRRVLRLAAGRVASEFFVTLLKDRSRQASYAKYL